MTEDQQQPPTVTCLTVACLTVWPIPSPDQAGSLTIEQARRLLDDHTQPGQIVIDLDHDPVLPDVAAATGRIHHALDGHTDPDVITRHTAHADLFLLRWPRPPTNPQHLLQTARTLLKDTGLLAIVTHLPTSKRTAHLTALTGAAHNVGLRLQRHIAMIVPTDEHSGQPTPPGTPQPHTDVLIFQSQAVHHD
jgi:hypothetical protein